MINNSINLVKFNHTLPVFCASSKFYFNENMNRSRSKVHTFLMVCVWFSFKKNKTLWLSLHLYACNAFITIFYWFRCKAKQKVFISWSAAWIIAHDSYQVQAICHVIKIKSVKAINHKFCKEVVFSEHEWKQEDSCEHETGEQWSQQSLWLRVHGGEGLLPLLAPLPMEGQEGTTLFLWFWI